VLLSGPVPGIIIGIIIYFIADRQNDWLFLRISYVFVLLNLFNLLPIYPLDGGQLLKTVFIGSREIISTVFIVISVAVTGWYAVYYSQWFLLIVPYFLIVRMVQQVKIKNIRKRLAGKNIGYHTPYGRLSDEQYWRIRDELAVSGLFFSRYITPEVYEASDKEINIINYIRTVLKNNPSRDLSRAGIILIVITWLAAAVVPLLVMTRIWYLF